MTGKSGIVQTFPNNLSGPEPSPDAIERLYRVGRQHQLGRSHASVTGSGLALSRRSLSKSGQTPCLCAVIPATSERANDGSRLRRQTQHAVNSRRFAHPVRAWRAAVEALVLHLHQDLQHLGGVIENRVVRNGYRLHDVVRPPAGRHRLLQPLGR